MIWYSVDEEKFICELNEAEIKDMGKKYLEVYVIKNFDEISSITHKNEYKRAYWNDRVWETTDWEF
ncbi:MAG: hypothetical protein LBF15_01810 [Candidatus Peribacteria bacterium]|nr:hypothetical protein [Candidatus Peribacteria bacterium]